MLPAATLPSPLPKGLPVLLTASSSKLFFKGLQPTYSMLPAAVNLPALTSPDFTRGVQKVSGLKGRMASNFDFSPDSSFNFIAKTGMFSQLIFTFFHAGFESEVAPVFLKEKNEKNHASYSD